MTGKVIAGRFLLLESQVETLLPQPAQQIDYAQPLPRCLTAAEDGRLHLKRGHKDLMIEAHLNGWAERSASDEWRLTAHSSAHFAPFLNGYRSPDLIFVPLDKLDAFKAELAWARVQLSSHLEIKPYPTAQPDKPKRSRRW